MVLEDLRGIDSIGARHGQQEQWNAIVGCAPTEAEQWRQVDPIMEAGQRCVVAFFQLPHVSMFYAQF